MNRTAKLIAYTLFALFFPLWIFLGRMSEKTDKTATNILDTVSLNLILKTAESINTNNTSSNDNNQAAWRVTLEKISSIISKPGATTVEVSPINVSVASKDTGIKQGSNPSTITRPVQFNTDGFEKEIQELVNGVDLLNKLNPNEPVIAETINLNTKQLSVHSDIRLPYPCCKKYQDTITYYTDSIFNLKKSISLLYSVLEKSTLTNNSRLKELLGLLDKTQAIAQKLKNRSCIFKNYIEIRNTTNYTFSLPDSLTLQKEFPFLKPAGIDIINDVDNTLKELKPNHTAYYKLDTTTICNIYEKFYPLKFDFEKKESFFKRPLVETIFINFKFLK